MKIRKAILADLNRIDEIYAEGSAEEVRYQFKNISKEKYEKDLEKHKISRKKGFRKNMRSQNHYWIVVVDAQNILGFGEAYLKNKDEGMIENVYVDKTAKRKGIGIKITKELIKWLKKKKVKNINSAAYIKNKPSLNMHKKLGFKPLVVRMRLKK